MKTDNEIILALGGLLFSISILLLGAFVYGALVMLIWNALMPTLGLITITYWQGFGLWLLCSLLFKNGGKTSLNFNQKDEEE